MSVKFVARVLKAMDSNACFQAPLWSPMAHFVRQGFWPFRKREDLGV